MIQSFHMEKVVSLNDSLENIFRLTPGQKRALNKLRLHTVDDLLHHFPARYTDAARTITIGSLKKGDQAAVYGKIHNLKTKKAWRKKIPMAEGTISDETGNIKAVWFHQPYIAKMTSEGGLVRVEGKVGERKGELFFSNPRIERVTEVPRDTGPLFGDGTSETLYPVYPESRGITSNWLYHAIVKMERSGVLDTVEDPIPDEILKKYNLPTADKPDSQGVCFIGEIDVAEFLKEKLGKKPGPILTLSGKKVGVHDGLNFYTIGQRKGIGSAGGGIPYYVVSKNKVRNALVVAKAENPALFSKELKSSV